MDKMGEIAELQKLIEDFANERDWGKYHTAKNLALALGSEVGELQAEFRWLSESENISEEKITNIRNEIADVGIFLLRLADVLGIDLNEAIKNKLVLNQMRNNSGPDFIK